MSEEDITEFNTIIFTRYLYSKIDVKQSMLLALLERQTDEALFWAYELYYSGFQHDCFDFVINIYEELYSLDNPGLRAPIQKLIDSWTDDENLDWNLGTIIITLASRNYSLNSFIKGYFDLECVDQKKIVSKNNLVIHLKEKDIQKYKTVEVERPWQYLRTACKYAIRKETNDLFKYVTVNKADFRDHWLYYSRETPFWVDKIAACDGEIDDEKKQIVFPDEDLEEQFYDAWNIEPDEQPLEIIERCIGKPDVSQLSLIEFCKKYGALPVLQKIKIAFKSCQLTNSITYK